MKRVAGLIVAGWLCLLPAISAFGFGYGFEGGAGGYNSAAVSGASYTGPGDVVSGAAAAYGLRAYNSADRGNRLINVCDPSNVTCADWSSSATTGKLVAGTNPLNGTDCTTATTCTVNILYDRSGALSCGGSACDASQSTASRRPTLNFNCVNGLPCLVFGANAFLSSPATLSAFAATATFSAVANRTASFTGLQYIASVGSSASLIVDLNFRSAASTLQMFAGAGGITVANISDSNFHAFQAAFNGASSDLMCGGGAGTNCSTSGTSNSISPGTTGTGTTSILCIGSSPNTGPACSLSPSGSFQLTEDLVYAFTFTGTQQTNMNANQYSFWGPF